jgi:hypothetical protein
MPTLNPPDTNSPVIASNFNQTFSPEQTRARRQILLLKKLAAQCNDAEIARIHRRSANEIYRQYFGYNARKLKASIIDLLSTWKECGLTEKEIIEELKIPNAAKPRLDFQNAFMELIASGEVFVLSTPAQPHQLGDHSYKVYSVL